MSAPSGPSGPGPASRAGEPSPLTQEAAFTLIDAGRVVETRARIAGEGVRLSPAALESTLGWTLEDGVLCNEGMWVRDGEIDLRALAAALDRPLALDVAERAAYLGVAAAERRRALESLAAPDFTLPDLAGRPHALSEHRGRKVLLVAWASW